MGTQTKAQHNVLLRKTIVRLSLSYLAPFVLLTVYFYLQSSQLLNEGRRIHLKTIAEQQGNTLDLFLRERVINLINLIDSPKLELPPSSKSMQRYLNELKKSSATFVDIGFFDSSGVQVGYSGPFSSLELKDYSMETWYVELRNKTDNFIITDIYLGFRKEPHFTIGVSRTIDGQYVVLRATLDPKKIHEFIISVEGTGEVYTSIVNKDGYYQVVTQHVGTLLEESSIVPPYEPSLGVEKLKIGQTEHEYGYSWLRSADWALIVQWANNRDSGLFRDLDLRIILVSLGIILIIFFVIVSRARQLVQLQEESIQTKTQLEHAARLASVGELAAGIAHEINNPLAIISEESGLMKDLMDPKYGEEVTQDEMRDHLDEIHEAVFRCRDITRKLLGFVRQTDIKLAPHDVNRLIDDVLDGFLAREMESSNIELVRKYEDELPSIVTDAIQLEQVFLNIINNAIDALDDSSGKMIIKTAKYDGNIQIEISDTGRGMDPEEIENIFLPFFTTKEVGKGTGLGLPVSYGIVKSLGGEILVMSEPDRGSTFTIILPFN
ncbi:MAG: ATP-binding protein [Candidatus Electryonea clarkiae]|nr:ATP-binding protein [Candidatus Electryonea clarkiae]MDP8287042.1 ATP-binding protein [Candidatus Electryonea clarkiae]